VLLEERVERGEDLGHGSGSIAQLSTMGRTRGRGGGSTTVGIVGLREL